MKFKNKKIKENNNITIFVPIRKGSKRIKNKNIKLFNGKPIIAWTIKTAIKYLWIKLLFVKIDFFLISWE